MYPCACCGYLTLPEPGHDTFDICRICNWEDDPVQNSDPDFEGGANTPSLRQAEANFVRFGACDEASAGPLRRGPRSDDRRDPDWKPLPTGRRGL